MGGQCAGQGSKVGGLQLCGLFSQHKQHNDEHTLSHGGLTGLVLLFESVIIFHLVNSLIRPTVQDGVWTGRLLVRVFFVQLLKYLFVLRWRETEFLSPLLFLDEGRDLRDPDRCIQNHLVMMFYICLLTYFNFGYWVFSWCNFTPVFLELEITNWGDISGFFLQVFITRNTFLCLT